MLYLPKLKIVGEDEHAEVHMVNSRKKKWLLPSGAAIFPT
jgi:hypothetical protein